MIDLTLCVAFGSVANHVVWAGTYRTEEPPLVGMRTQLHLSRDTTDEDDEQSIIAEVVYADDDDAGDPIAYLFAGEDLPDDDLATLLGASAWVKLGTDAALGVMTIVDAAPPTAAVHDILLIVGDPAKVDEQGRPDVEAWNRSITPDDPLIPMFAERIYVDVVDMFPDDGDYDEDEDEDEDDDLDGVDQDTDDEYDPDTDDEYDPDQPIDLNEVGSAADGFPALVFYAAKVEPGEAQIGFWISSLGETTGFDLVAAGWTMLAPEEFDPVEFRVSERVALAHRTHITTDYNEYGDPFLVDYEMDDASTTREDQFELLPPLLAEHCRVAQEMNDLESVLESWQDEGSQP